jgi:hypothetical protein
MHEVGVLIRDISVVAIHEKVNFAISLLGEVVRHLADRNMGNPFSNFHVWGDIASAMSDLSKIHTRRAERNLKKLKIMERLAKLAKEFEDADTLKRRRSRRLVKLVDSHYSPDTKWSYE